MKSQTLLGEYGPVLDTLKQFAAMVPGASTLIDALESKIESAVQPVLEGGATAPGPDLDKRVGGLQSTGYVYIGEDPETQDSFNVDDEDGQRKFTTVVLNEEDARRHQ